MMTPEENRAFKRERIFVWVMLFATCAFALAAMLIPNFLKLPLY